MSDSLRDTIAPKSDQLNADDLLGTSMTITVTKVSRGSSTEQPVTINWQGDNGRPYKPCKSMRRVLIFAWGEDGRDWTGRSMTLYTDPSVKFGGVVVGGIRISHLSHIKTALSMSLTATRGKRTPYTVEPLTVKLYDSAKFDQNIAAWEGLIESGKATADQIIAKAEQAGGQLTQAMRDRIKNGASAPQQTNDKEF